MARKYWLHRISYEWDVSSVLLEQGYLSLGWNTFSNTDILDRIKKEGLQGFENFMTENNEASRSRWNLWYFSQFKIGDIVLVPLPDGKFNLFEVVEEPVSVTTVRLGYFKNIKHEIIKVSENGLINTLSGYCYDIGFLIKVKALKEKSIPRSYAFANLVSRMKIRTTNADISDLKESIEAALVSDGPIMLHDVIVSNITCNIESALGRYVTPDKLENIVKWYMHKKGANRVWIPSKNEPNKENGADADVIAEFDDLGVIFYIQVKNHQDYTDAWATHQISEYKNQRENNEDNYTYIPWVISTADFTENVRQDAKAKGVRLINGIEFIKMLIDVGIDDIDSAFE